MRFPVDQMPMEKPNLKMGDCFVQSVHYLDNSDGFEWLDVQDVS